ncbi:MAG TPA: GGDEF-domain containing protein [Vibrio sp.]|nr:GGDEF-domain containing protein [Vibrio sp.]
MEQFEALEQIHTPIWIYDFDQQSIFWANPAALLLWEAESLEELVTRDLKTGMSQAVKTTLDTYRKQFDLGERFRKWWSITPKQIHKRVLCDFSGVELAGGRLAMLVHALSEESHLRSNLAFSDGSNLSLLFDPAGNLLSANDAFQQFYPLALTHLSTLTGSTQRADKWLTEAQYHGEVEKETNLTINDQSYNFRIIANWVKNKDQLLLQLTDISQQKKQILAAQFEANHDCLTELYNRRGLLTQANSWTQTQHGFHLVFIDLDGFKMINDTYGHGQGDALLIAVARRLQQSLPDSLALARFGGDEFVALLPMQDSLSEKLTQINQLLRAPYHLKSGITVSVNASLGCTTFDSQDPLPVETLIQYAGHAMHKAKKQGKNRYQIFTSDLAQAIIRKSQIRQCLSSALESNQFSLYYQPIFCCKSGNLYGAEALLRWHDDKLGHISPTEFIPIAEDSGQIVALGDWVLQHTIEQLSQWQVSDEQEFVVSINVSRIQLHRGFSTRIAELIERYQVKPSQIAIELTESCMVYKMQEVKQWLSELSQIGVKIYLDDFGTGYSSLSVLQQLPIDVVKLDKSFVQSSQEGGLAIIQATVAICEKLELAVVAEGIEEEYQKELLCQNNYSYLQGYLFSRPIPAKQFALRYLV